MSLRVGYARDRPCICCSPSHTCSGRYRDPKGPVWPLLPRAWLPSQTAGHAGTVGTFRGSPSPLVAMTPRLLGGFPLGREEGAGLSVGAERGCGQASASGPPGVPQLRKGVAGGALTLESQPGPCGLQAEAHTPSFTDFVSEQDLTRPHLAELSDTGILSVHKFRVAAELWGCSLPIMVWGEAVAPCGQEQHLGSMIRCPQTRGLCPWDSDSFCVSSAVGERHTCSCDRAACPSGHGHHALGPHPDSLILASLPPLSLVSRDTLPI